MAPIAHLEGELVVGFARVWASVGHDGLTDERGVCWDPLNHGSHGERLGDTSKPGNFMRWSNDLDMAGRVFWSWFDGERLVVNLRSTRMLHEWRRKTFE